MSDERALTITTGMSLQDTMTLGQTLAESGFFSDAKKAAQAVVKILAGRELGFGPIASMTGIHIVNGKPTLGANLIAAKIKGSGRYTFRIAALDNERCELAIFENGEELQPRSLFTMEDAVQAGLTTGKNAHSWKHYPRNMMFARAISNAARWHCPELFDGNTAYTPEELGAEVDGEGEIINVTPTRVERSEPTPTTTTSTTPTPTPATDGNGNGKRALPSFKAETVQAVVEAGHAEDIPAAIRRLNKSTVLHSNDDAQAVVKWAEMYATHRDVGLSSDDAAATADQEWSEAVAGSSDGQDGE